LDTDVPALAGTAGVCAVGADLRVSAHAATLAIPAPTAKTQGNISAYLLSITSNASHAGVEESDRQSKGKRRFNENANADVIANSS
jgi:hypothetical protein